MGKKEKHPPESNEALEAVEEVIRTAKRKKNFFEANVIPLKGDTKKEKRRKFVFVILLLIMVSSASVVTWFSVLEPIRGRNMEDHFRGYRSPETTAEAEPPTGGAEVVQTTKPVVSTTRQPLDKLLARNRDLRFWISAPGGRIEYPVVQYTDNDYYLHRNFDRKLSRYGNPFLDRRCKLDPPSTNLVIYGHNMRDGSIFSGLKNYRQRDVVARHPIITLERLDGSVYQYKIFAVLVINGRLQDDNGYAFAVNTHDFPTQASFEGYVRQLEQRTTIKTGVDVRYGDKLISLQTCLFDVGFDDAYLYVVGRMVRPGESIKVDSAGVKTNQNPRLPQAMYDKRKQKNPYAGAELWFPG